MRYKKRLTAIIAISGLSSFLILQPLFNSSKEQATVKINVVARSNSMPMLATTPNNDLQHFTDLPSPSAKHISSLKNVKLIAYQHKKVLQHPAYSQPITDESNPYLHWNRFEIVPLPILGGNAQAALNVNKYRHFYPDKINVTLSSSTPVISSTLDIIDVQTQQVLTHLPMRSDGWEITSQANWPEEIRLVARTEFEQGEDIVSADIRLYQHIADIIRVGQSYAENTDMLIPVTLKVDKTGIYRIRGSLYQTNGSAIALLTQKHRLSQGSHTMTLKAFHSVLPSGNVSYELRNIFIEKMSGFPGQKAQYGQAEASVYPVGHFNADILSDDPYQLSENEKKQLEFLNQAANSI
ncbi:hypothetical protein [Vibrio sagamiensis]|uniref:Uncharacterized protein n=1 Tax=Vibrio sagamiensis NBRC 104589 TaxID=1219064 RepID=A0A511QD31_9VIBR|nr:hypothetical protein [Vibrio sagamiensis]PNQ66922.1 hypothetical protein C1141_08250 [Vibrio agarivorans]GEM75214.1 hypothetical protein VSA01S_13260 [Vibrio sagamiensis NBRC 104589]